MKRKLAVGAAALLAALGAAYLWLFATSEAPGEAWPLDSSRRGGLAESMEGDKRSQIRARAIATFDFPVRALHELQSQQPKLTHVPGHDTAVIDDLITRGRSGSIGQGVARVALLRPGRLRRRGPCDAPPFVGSPESVL